MKIQDGEYRCDWCGIEFKKNVGRYDGAGKKGVCVSQCICIRCCRHVSQKTKIEREYKLSRGQKV